LSAFLIAASSVKYASIPRIGLMPACLHFLKKVTAPKILPWSVVASAFKL
jgi:hypothetical protein